MKNFMSEFKTLDSIQRKLVMTAIKTDLDTIKKGDIKLDSLYRWCKKNIYTI